MKLTIQRFQEGQSRDEVFDIASLKVTTLLSALYEIKAKLDPTLTFLAGCRSGVCGACAVRVNGREKLACSYIPKDGDRIEPLQYHPVLRDLKVDKSKAQETLKPILPHLSQRSTLNAQHSVSPEEEAKYRLQTDCILCDSCYSACPVYAVNPDFLGPFALTRAWRHLSDTRWQESSTSQISTLNAQRSTLLEKIQKNGIWDCTLCGECTAVCPQHIDPKGDIMQLRGESLKAGYNDPNFAAQSFGGPDFGGGFGFDPNGGF
ncbi:succinate dehydrogenase/fumarate reductase iron-sulfur subunit [Nitratifractor salsuginis]|uniref:Fumarate reductase iron-sulfur subunit n=1 Tax=Nitratifractor salsuginis (strain DSM 16511 / JCM 12458 / E9I37-1) TaxID=749222 RepID=E6WZ60_NITSE|nr:2Fe-2S iron-sulfur cluster-binding protein [Nitratifractor salsuginis]ADV45510.1 succinate dehydrogenase and fumarate reductase iron-sulfur protein [Nitratifractor salsuginis DSM 16511]